MRVVWLLLLLLITSAQAQIEVVEPTTNVTALDFFQRIDWNRYVGGTVGFMVLVANWMGSLIVSLVPKAPPMLGWVTVVLIFIAMLVAFLKAIGRLAGAFFKYLILIIVVVFASYLVLGLLAMVGSL